MTDSRARFPLPFAILAAVLAVSTASILIRFAQSDGAPSFVIAALRLTFATLILTPIAFTKYLEEIKRITPTEILLGAFSGIFLALHFATWISSLEYTSVASSVVFVSTAPLWVALLSPILLREHLAQTAMIGLGLSLAGGAIIGLSDACVWDAGLSCLTLQDVMQGRAMWGNFLALTGAWTVTGYLIIGRKLRVRLSLIPYIFMVYGFGAIILNIIMITSGISPLGYMPKTYAWILLLAIVPQLIGHSTFNWALKYAPASFVAVTTLGEPVGSAILAFFILNETPSLAALIGGALILSGIYLASRQTTMNTGIKVVIVMGVAGAGKSLIGSLLARELGWSFYDADDFHSESNRMKMSQNIPLTDEDRAGWLAALQGLIRQKIQHGTSIVLACSALKNSYRSMLMIDEQVKFVYLQGTYKQIESRLRQRTGHYMSAKMLASQFDILEEPQNALIVDITLTPQEIISIIRRGLS